MTDRDNIISVFGVPKRELHEKRISQELEQLLEERQFYQRRAGERGIPAAEGVPAYMVSIAAPIISGGDLMGSVLFLTTEGAQPLGEVESKLAQTVAKFLGKQMED